ncbi:SAM-dependent methyltransferase [Chryseolinea sp. H1M3-3]|uniref:SAM-dependent methyltransferase n=1 Tax=Chryseolinea sp. H1M3-3 TaxID=3034144 RepID=UPI0023ECB409|nr:SAM-dependent methyltransferase [Chryseolinea sp. H1M3-3]
MNIGKLFLVPNIISDNTHLQVIPPHVFHALTSTQHFLAEDIRTARRFLSSLKIYEKIEELEFQVLDKDSKYENLRALFGPLFKGANMGIISEAGCPGVADPGALAVKFAHENDIQVVPLVGPSSILLALMASGLNGQRFAFHGYLPIEPKDCARAIHDLEKESLQKNQTQIIIETPYRNNHLKELLMKHLKNDTLLSIAQDVTGQQESIRTYPIKKWKTISINMPKIPAVFMFLSF